MPHIDDARYDPLWERVRAGDEQAREEIILGYLPVAQSVARRAWERIGDRAAFSSRDDLTQIATLGLMDAITRYDPEKGGFAGYASKRCHGAIIDAVREQSFAPRSVVRKATHLDRTLPALEQRLGRTPTVEEAAEELGMTPEEFKTFRRKAALPTFASLDRREYESEEEAYERIATSDPDPAAAYEAVLDQGRLRDLLDAQPARTKAIFALYFFHGMKLREIGEALGVTESRISQIVTKETDRLRQMIERSERAA